MSSSIQFHKVADRSGPEPPRDPETGEYATAWPLKHVALVGKAPAEHDFTEGQVMRAVSEGWASFDHGDLVFHLKDGDLTYRVTSAPDDENEDGTRSGTFSAELITKGSE